MARRQGRTTKKTDIEFAFDLLELAKDLRETFPDEPDAKARTAEVGDLKRRADLVQEFVSMAGRLDPDVEVGDEAPLVDRVREHIRLEDRAKAAKAYEKETKDALREFDVSVLGPAWDEEGVESITVDGRKVSPREDRWLLPEQGISGVAAAQVLKTLPETREFVKEGYSATALRSWLREKEDERAEELYERPMAKLSPIERAEVIESFELPEELRKTFHVDIRRTFRSVGG